MPLCRSYAVGTHVANARGPAFVAVCRCVCESRCNYTTETLVAVEIVVFWYWVSSRFWYTYLQILWWICTSELPKNKESIFIWQVLWLFSLDHVTSAVMEEAEFMTYTTTGHWGRSEWFGFTFGDLSCPPSLYIVKDINKCSNKYWEKTSNSTNVCAYRCNACK